MDMFRSRLIGDTMFHFSPCKQLLFEVRQLGASVHEGTPAWAQFPRWFRDGSRMWLESSSGSVLLTVDFVHGVVRVPEWKVRRDGTEPKWDMPENWESLYLGSLFNADGSAVYPEEFEAARHMPAAHREIGETVATCTVICRASADGRCGEHAVFVDPETGFAECAWHVQDAISISRSSRIGPRVGDTVDVHRYGKVYRATVVKVGSGGAVWVEFTYGNGKVQRVRV